MSAKDRQRNYYIMMGKFREHTLEEIRRLRNARQKRKRQQRAAERVALEREKIMKELEHERRTASKLRETAHKFCRKWREECQENNKMRNLLLQYRPQVRFLKGVLIHVILALADAINEYISNSVIPCEVAQRAEYFCHRIVY